MLVMHGSGHDGTTVAVSAVDRLTWQLPAIVRQRPLALLAVLLWCGLGPITFSVVRKDRHLWVRLRSSTWFALVLVDSGCTDIVNDSAVMIVRVSTEVPRLAKHFFIVVTVMLCRCGVITPVSLSANCWRDTVLWLLMLL